MGYQADYVMVHCKELYEQWEKHMKGDDEPEKKEEAVTSAVILIPVTDVAPVTEVSVLKKDSAQYMMALREQRRAAYEKNTECIVDEGGIPVRPTCTLHQSTWQSWFNEIETKVYM